MQPLPTRKTRHPECGPSYHTKHEISIHRKMHARKSKINSNSKEQKSSKTFIPFCSIEPVENS